MGHSENSDSRTRTSEPSKIERITVWLVDDNTQFTSILCESLKNHSSIECAKIFCSGTSLLEYLETDPPLPNVILLDINMPGISGIETLSQIKILAPEIHVLMLTVNVQDESIRRALEIGASGYLLKSSSLEELVHNIHAAMKGGIPIDPFVIPRVFALYSQTQSSTVTNNLTDREQEILQLLSDGLLTQQIADELCLSVYTVQTHIKKIFKKMDVHTRQQLVAKALREKII
ncbi:MAG: response regulator transcription factor [Bacteroidetes bacterium]|nr:response regulator transcription factor [Bacteroidota bacterium]